MPFKAWLLAFAGPVTFYFWGLVVHTSIECNYEATVGPSILSGIALGYFILVVANYPRVANGLVQESTNTIVFAFMSALFIVLFSTALGLYSPSMPCPSTALLSTEAFFASLLCVLITAKSLACLLDYIQPPDENHVI